MANEYKPTRRVEVPGGGYEPDQYGSPAFQSGTAKTERLQVEPPTFAWLVIIEGVHAGHIFRLHSDATLIGRDPSCDIVLDDTATSRQHAKIRTVEGEDKQKMFVLHDLATENGTFVNDEEIVKHELSDGDRILIGRTKLVFKQVQV